MNNKSSMSVSFKWLFFAYCTVLLCGKTYGQTAERNVFSVFSPVADNDSLSLAGGQIMTGVSGSPIVEHGYYPLNHSLLSIDEISETWNYKVYPNPFATSFFIQWSTDIEDEVLIDIYTINGVLVQSKRSSNSSIEIGLENQAPGIYYLKVYTAERLVFNEKIIKN